jgi:hypothetical protein
MITMSAVITLWASLIKYQTITFTFALAWPLTLNLHIDFHQKNLRCEYSYNSNPLLPLGKNHQLDSLTYSCRQIINCLNHSCKTAATTFQSNICRAWYNTKNKFMLMVESTTTHLCNVLQEQFICYKCFKLRSWQVHNTAAALVIHNK